MNYRHGGFSLIELVIVFAIIGILAVFAYPAYGEYARRGYRAEARSQLLLVQQWLERGATAAGTYTTKLPAGFTWSMDESKPYIIEFKSATTMAFTLRAKRKNGKIQEDDKCGDYTLTHTGLQGNEHMNTAKASTEDCWRR